MRRDQVPLRPRRPERLPMTVNNYRRHGTGKNERNEYIYRRPSTTTSSTSCENDYFPLRNDSFLYVSNRPGTSVSKVYRNDPVDDPCDACCVVWNVSRVCSVSVSSLLSCSSVASSPTRGNPVTGSSHLSSRLTHSVLPFASDSQRVTGTDMLPCFIFRSLPWHPFIPPR